MFQMLMSSQSSENNNNKVNSTSQASVSSIEVNDSTFDKLIAREEKNRMEQKSMVFIWLF